MQRAEVNVQVTAVPTVFDEDSYHILLANRYIGTVLWLGSRNDLEAWFAPEAILNRLRQPNYTPTDTELEIISLLA